MDVRELFRHADLRRRDDHGVNCGQVRGPVQLTFARRSIPSSRSEHSITRMAVATEAEAEKQGGDNRTMGRKFTVPYGLYRAHGFVSAFSPSRPASPTTTWSSCGRRSAQMFEHDRSAARGRDVHARALRLQARG